MLVYTLPIIAALIGWLTNYIAVKMLFHPRTEKSFLFIKLHGVFPKRQKALAHKIGHLVSSELFSVGEVTDHLKENAISDATMEHIALRLKEIISGKLPEVFPMLKMFLNDEMVERITEIMLGRVKEMIKELIGMLSTTLEKDLDVHTIVEEKVAAFSSDKLEEVLFAIMKKEFRFIELVGGVLGFMIGLVQVGLMLLA